MIELELTDSPAELEQIVELQRLNHIDKVDAALWETEGFVTLEFTVQKLRQMKGAYKHVVAKVNNKVVGYALVLLRQHSEHFPFLDEMFRTIDAAVFNGYAVKEKKYFVMGQICVEKKFRGKGLFKTLYHKLKEQMQEDFDFVVTEVSKKNVRSVNAHKRVGFKDLTDVDSDATEWKVIAWDWQ
ncbi:MAG: GNAT family N-acetyltransferase [Bacteroidota bacterium]